MKLRLLAAAVLTTGLAVLGLVSPTQAATVTEKISQATTWTQATTTSQRAWNSARSNQIAGYNWTTDYCSSSPDQPFGFDFRLSCHRHDFGYRNFKAFGVFSAHKARVDDAFYFDMKQVCGRYSGASKSLCLGTAWTYYQAVKKFGSVSVAQSELDRQASALR